MIWIVCLGLLQEEVKPFAYDPYESWCGFLEGSWVEWELPFAGGKARIREVLIRKDADSVRVKTEAQFSTSSKAILTEETYRKGGARPSHLKMDCPGCGGKSADGHRESLTWTERTLKLGDREIRCAVASGSYRCGGSTVRVPDLWFSREVPGGLAHRAFGSTVYFRLLAFDAPEAVSWPEADALFRRDPRWLGADAAFSVPLGDGRILWLFGDTFVAKTPKNVRSESVMVRNSVAVQRGSDPTNAEISFHWKPGPGSYFPEDGDRWFWPQHGIRIGRALVLFLVRAKATPGRGLGFESEGWRAALVEDASESPDRWTVRMLAPSKAPAGLIAGAGLSLVGEHVVSLAVREPGDHAGHLVRWKASDLAAGRIDDAEWWTGTWSASGTPKEIMPNAGPESSLHFDGKQWVHVRSDGFGATTIVVSFAAKLEGPWSKPRAIFRPPESAREKPFVYAAKAHPALAGADLVATYATNDFDFGTVVRDTTLYYPRFVRIRLR